MRHRRAGVKLNRSSSHRQAMFRNMVTSLLKHERIKTTDVRAKELRRWADHIITLAKRGDLHARRQALAIVREKAVVHKIFEEAKERFGKINGGYTRIVKLGKRPGDAATISMIELVSAEDKPKKKKKKAAPKKKAAAAKAPAKDQKAEAKAADTQAEAQAPVETLQEEAAAADSGQAQAQEAADAQADAQADEADAAPQADAAPEAEAAPQADVEDDTPAEAADQDAYQPAADDTGEDEDKKTS